MGFALHVPDRRTLVVGFGITLGNTAQSAIPWIVGAFVDSVRLSLHQASLMVTSEVSAMGITMLAASSFVHKIPKKLVFFLATAVAIAAQIACFNTGNLELLAILRAISGVGFGLIYSIASAIGAGSRVPTRTYANAGTIALLLGILINPLLGYGLQQFGAKGVFGGIVILASVLAIPLFLLWFDGDETSASETSAVIVTRDTIWNRTNVLAVAGVVLTMALMSAAVSGLYVLLQGIAQSVGLSSTTLGAGMSIVSLFGATGGMWANLFLKRFGHAWPLLVGLPVFGALVLGMTLISGEQGFWAMFIGIVVMFWFLYPFIFGLAAVVDPKGRAASTTGSGKILLASGGTALAGYLGEMWGVAAYGIAALSMCLVAMLLAAGVLWLLRDRIDSASAAWLARDRPEEAPQA